MWRTNTGCNRFSGHYRAEYLAWKMLQVFTTCACYQSRPVVLLFQSIQWGMPCHRTVQCIRKDSVADFVWRFYQHAVRSVLNFSLLVVTVYIFWEIQTKTWDRDISYYAGLPFYLDNDLRRNSGLLAVSFDGICYLPFYLAFGDFYWDLGRISHRGTLLMILRWLILIYGSLRF